MNDRAFQLYLKLWKTGKAVGCHQKPERSFFIGNWQFPVCARCTGVFLGQPVMLLLFFCGIPVTLSVSLIFLGIMLGDWLLQHFKILSSTNLRRLITGTLGGAGLAGLYILILQTAYHTFLT